MYFKVGNMKDFTFMWLLAASVILTYAHSVAEDIKYSRHELPTLYTFDEYDECLQTKSDTELASTYCMVYAEINPDNSSDLWLKIMAHSAKNFCNYRYDRLFFGVCLNRCFDYANTSALNENSSIESDAFVNNEVSKYLTKVYSRPFDLKLRQNYADLIHRCLNDQFERKYNLSLRTFIEYCEAPKEREIEERALDTDPAHKLLWGVIKVLVLLIVLSSIYDYKLKKQQSENSQTNEFYKANLTEPVRRALTSFSLCRNYYRLLQPYRSNSAEDLSYLDGFRSFITFGVIAHHVIFLNCVHIQNPESFEYLGNTSFGNILLNIPVCLEIFMVMSGLVVGIKFQQLRLVAPDTDLGKCWKVAALLIVQRFLRYLPSVGFFVLVSSTFVGQLTDGPFTRHIYELNRAFGRKNWWKNILLINNFSHAETIAPHTWYIATDFHLYVIYIIVLIAMAKYPQYKYRIFKCLAVLACLIPTAVNYLMKLKIVYMPVSEIYRIGSLLESREFSYQYTPFYTNLGGYLMGIWCSDFYLNHVSNQQLKKKLSKYTLPAIFVVIFTGFGIFWLGTIMMFKEHSIVTAIYSGVHRNLWIAIVCGLPIIFMMFKLGGIFYDFCNLPIFRVLSRLSFQMYLWHLIVLMGNVAHMRQPVHINVLLCLNVAFATYTFSAFIAFVITLFVELPFAQLQDVLMTIMKGSHTSGRKLQKSLQFAHTNVDKSSIKES